MVDFVGRFREFAALDSLLDRAAAGSGGVLVVAGPVGSGRTTLVEVVAKQAQDRGFEVCRGTPVGGHSGGRLWAQLLRDAGAPDELATRLLTEPTWLDVDAAASALCSGPRRLIVVDDVDLGGPVAVEVLTALAARAAAGPTAVVATSGTSLGVGDEAWLGPLSLAEIGTLTGEVRPDVRHALWVASRGLPGPARTLASTLPSGAAGDPVVRLALGTFPAEGFLDIDTGQVRLLETALPRAADDATRARLLARLAYALLGEAAATERRRTLVHDALSVARRCGDAAVLAEVLDARLHALWDPAGAEDRLSAAEEIVDLARGSADLERERRGLFWRFVALMELGRVGEAEAALAAFDRESAAAGAEADRVMVVARHAMLAAMRGRFDDAQQLAEQVAERGGRARLADTERLVATIRGAIGMLRGDRSVDEGEAVLRQLRAFTLRIPGHFYEATVARNLLSLGRPAEAGLELERALPGVLAGSGPRWLGAMADLAAVAVATGNTDAAARLYPALAGYRGRLVVWAGANTITGPVAHYLGILAAALGRLDDAVDLLSEAMEWERKTGALPFLASTAAALADTLTSRGRDGDAARASGHRRQARDIAGQLGMAMPPARSADEWTLRRDGSDWILTAGDEQARLRDGRGLHYLRPLLAAPGQEIAALDLVAGGTGLAAATAEPVLDTVARDAYRRRLAELDDELDAADATGDHARAERADIERQAILAELHRTTGLGGRPRAMAAEDERARVNVTRTLRASVERISAAAPKAGAYLTASIRTGRACRYQPAPGGPPHWHF